MDDFNEKPCNYICNKKSVDTIPCLTLKIRKQGFIENLFNYIWNKKSVNTMPCLTLKNRK